MKSVCLSVAGLSLVCVMGLGGCTSYTPPAMNVVKAEAKERTPDGAAMLFTLDARNDNEDALPLRSVEYRVDLDGQEVFSGTRSAEATLRRLGVQQITLPAVVALNSPARQGLVQGKARYRLSGQMYYVTPGQLAELLFDAGVRTPSTPFSAEGEIDFGQANIIPAPSPAPVSTAE